MTTTEALAVVREALTIYNPHGDDIADGLAALALIEERLGELEYLHDLDHKLADQHFTRAEKAEAERDVLNGSACAEEQAMGNGPCGVCVTCLRAERDKWKRLANELEMDRDKQDARVAELEAALRKIEKEADLRRERHIAAIARRALEGGEK